MTRVYIQPSWINAAEDHSEWSGGNDQYRGDRSIDISTFDKNGRARVEAFSDEAIQSRRDKKKTSVPLVDRVLPQQRRVRVLTEQLYELEAERKNGMDIHTYSQLRDILVCKRDRAEVLLKKAVSVKPVNKDVDDPDLYEETEKDEAFSYAENHVNTTHHTSTWVDDLPDSNSLKRPIKIVCTLVKGLVRFTSASKRYIKTLQEV